MLKLSDRKWKKFVVGDIFTVESTETNEMFRFKKGTTPFICASNFNNGIQGFIEPNTDTKIYPKNSLTVSSLDGTTFFQDKDFVGRGHGSVQVLINKELNRYNSLFIATIIKKYCTPLNLSYSNQLFLNKLKQLEIELPCTEDKQPDWKFMEKYIYERERDNNQNLMSKFNKFLPKLNTKSWKKFKIIDIFKYQIGDIKKISEEEGNYKLISCSSFNNGVVGTTNNPKFSNCLSVATNGECGKCFYQNEPFGATIDTLMLFNDKLNKNNGLFLSTVISKTLLSKYSYSFKNKGMRTLNEYIQLPADKMGNPDWKYMGNYIKASLIK